MREGARIDDDEGDAVVFRRLNLADQFVFRIALPGDELMTLRARLSQ